MTGCECKSGFFSLRDCEEPPSTSCAECGRMVCARHLSPASGFTRCLDCQARAAQAEQGQAPPPPGDPALDDEWTYGARHRYYSSGYHPLYTGSRYHHYYDTYDTRSFDETDAGDVDAGDGGAGFGDS